MSMANWEAFRVSDVVTKISNNEFVLPVIQRRLVWNEEKMEMLFDTLLKGNSFGGIICIEEERGSEPLFAFRPFTKDGNPVDSMQRDVLNQNHMFVIDGQQRLQTFYIGLLGSYAGKEMYFDLFSDFKNLEYSFKFENEESRLPKQDLEKETIQRHMWYSARDLFKRLKETNDEDQVAEEIIKLKAITDEQEKNHIMRNVKVFYKNIFSATNIGISKININKSLDLNANRQRVVELFRRLNDGGTKLSSYDLVASILKGFDWRMERFLDSILADNDDIGLTQDTLINLLFILRDTPMKQMTEINAEDAEFATKYFMRIQQTMKLLKKFLKAAGLYNYYLKEKNRSYIPLYFIAYNIFYRTPLDQPLDEDMFDTFDTSDTNFKKMYVWLYKSLLNGVFSRGCGWIPYKTGIKKISSVVKEYKLKDFPTEELFDIYKNHPLRFHDNIDLTNLRELDKDVIFYMIYDNELNIREQDIDHIHPVNILRSNGYDEYEINVMGNYQLLDSGTNRGIKNGKPLDEWINNHVENKDIYLRRHLIPADETLWKATNYTDFLKKREELIVEKINKKLSI
jgi:uncharacterized protein with ParB-like and HNH nuclease domain